MQYLYHGSAAAGISALEPRSRLHGSDKQVVYLTDNIPCALFYIWDSAHVGCEQKHVTGGIRDGIAFYEEQFAGQLEAFYAGVSGYLYRVPKTPAVRPLDGREGLYYAAASVIPAEAQYIPDVYQALLRHEALGGLTVRRYREQTPERQQELVELIAEMIRREHFCRDNPAQAAFLQNYFAAAWDRAVQNASRQ